MTSILTKSNRMVSGITPNIAEEGGYDVISEDETKLIRLDSLNDRVQQTLDSDLPNEEKEAVVAEIQEQVFALQEEGEAIEGMPWVDPLMAVSGPMGFSKVANKTFGMLTRQALTGPAKSLSTKRLTKAVLASAAVEMPVGQTIETIDDALPIDTPWYLRVATPLLVGIGGGMIAQTWAEKAISGMAQTLRKQGHNISSGQMKTAVNRVQRQVEDELSLVTIVNDISTKKRPKKARIEKFKATKTKPGKESKADMRARIKATKTPLFLDDPSIVPNDKYATLDQIKDIGRKLYPESFQEAESVEEFFLSKPTGRKLIKELSGKDFEGITEKGYTRKFWTDVDKPTDTVDLKDALNAEILKRAKASAGANTVTGMTGGIFAGLETDEEGNITGFNPARALAVGVSTAIGGAYAMQNYSKFIAGIKGMGQLSKTVIKNEERLLKETAYKLDVLGEPPLKTALGTGWYKGKEGKYRKYVPNEEVSINNKVLKSMRGPKDLEKLLVQSEPVTLKELLSFPVMEDYYGKTVMKNTKVIYEPSMNKGLASFNPVTDTILLHQLETNKENINNILHETQHAIQKYEGFSVGTNSDIMGLAFDTGVNSALKLKSQQTLEDKAMTEAFSNILKTFTKDAQLWIKNLMKSAGKNRLKGNMIQSNEDMSFARYMFSQKAYNASYGEVEARIGSKPVILKDIPFNLKKLTDTEKWIETESLLVPLWDIMSSSVTKDSLDATLALSQKMASEGLQSKSFVKRWEEFADNRIIVPFQHWIDSKIYSNRMRQAFGIDLPKKYRKLITEYDRQTNRILDHTMTIAKELDGLAPTQKEQKRLLQILRGGITSDPEKAQAAKRVQELFTELRTTSEEMGLRTYDMYDAYTQAERSQLQTIIRLSDNKEKVLEAQQALKGHYRAGTAYEYVPTFLKSEEGVIGKERKSLMKRLNKLKSLARRATDILDDEPLPHIRDEITEIEEVLAVTKANSYNAKQKQLTQTYANVTSPAEANVLLNKTQDGINSASFTASRGLSEQAIDIQRNTFLKTIANNSDWALSKDFDVKYVPNHFKKLVGKKYGELDGMYVDRDIAKDIDDLGEVTNSFIRNYDKILGLWKLMKAVYNPATHVGNFTSNIFLAYLGGVNPADMKTYNKAAQALTSRMKNKWFKEAESWGLMNNTFSAAELSQFRKSLASFREHPKSMTTAVKVKKTMDRAVNYPSAMYEKNEQFFKMAVFIKAREEGLSIDLAAKKAEEYLFNYRDIPPIVRHYKRWASPFFTFTYKATGLLAKEIIRHPAKLALLGGAYMTWQKVAEYQTGSTHDEIKKEKQSMTGFGIFDMLLPWKDEDGNRMYWDISRLVPMGQYTDKWGQTGLPLGSFAPTANPLIAVAYELAINKDMFTGQEIVNTDIDDFMHKMGFWAEHIYKEMTPSLAPGNYGFNNLAKGLKSLERDVVDYTGQEVTMQDMVVRSVFGFKVTSATKQAMHKSLRSEVMKIDRGIGKRLNQLKTQYQRGEITKEEYDEVSGKLFEQKRFFKENIFDRLKE